MHSKRKGNIGQFAVGLELTKLGYSVFTEEGDISKIDILAEKDGKILRIQVKAITPTNDKLILQLKKSGPNYKFYYELGMFDYFGLYDLDDGHVYLVPDSVLANNSTSFNLSKKTSKNNQISGVHAASDYLIEKMLS
jgi:hypothetical protein